MMKSILIGVVLPFIICILLLIEGCAVKAPLDSECELLELRNTMNGLIIDQYNVLYNTAVEEVDVCIDKYNELAEDYNNLYDIHQLYVEEHPEL